jgi:hypothetical protein
MALTNQERVTRAMTLLKDGLAPFVERELEAVYKEDWTDCATRAEWRDGAMQWDVANLLATMWENWNDVFRTTLGYAERSLVSELREWRNKWAHQEPFSTDDAYRCMDSAERLLKSVSAPEAVEVERQKQEMLRIRFDEAARKETRRAATVSIEGQPLGGLKCWRDIVTPHPDVASGRYQQAEFAADLGQVYRGEGSVEYRDPVEFYRRTYLTEGLKMLLGGALKRLGGAGGDPVVELQTNFGGGKTHSMLALFHLFGGSSASQLAGIEPVLHAAGISQLPCARRAVFVGHDPSLAQVNKKLDGTVIHTMWGEIAWQLLGREGYEIVQAADETGTSPGTALMRELFALAAPCLVLIDEWIVFVRQLYNKDTLHLPVGSFDANLAFAQSLTEAAKAVPGALVVASVPASDIEVGGEGGREALLRLRNTFGRLESAWRPASAEESFEIVRRRLFQPISDPQKFKERDAVLRAFSEMYRQNAPEFPAGCGETDYERRMRDAYPIHPELFDRLYQDWSSLDKFQRTRGVLRLMATVIYELWENQDSSLLILPATVPLSAGPVFSEVTHYLEDPWKTVIDTDVDGSQSLPMRLDRENPNLMRFSACRRVARTIFLGSAPTVNTSRKGIEDRQIRLGCIQAGESIPTFGDALRRLTDNATHLYVDEARRYWFSTQPSVTRMAQERVQQYSEDRVNEEIKQRLQEYREARNQGDFARVYIAPPNAGEVPDDRECRLVILGPEHAHSRGAENSKARKEAAILLEQRGTGPRLFRNMLVFLAPDQTRLEELEQAVRQYLAWKSIEAERETLNLDAFQSKQAKTRREQSDEAVKQRIPETYQWLLVPEQPDPNGPMQWQEMRLQGQEGLAARASRKLRSDGILILHYAGTLVRHELDKILWRNTDHVAIRKLMDYFAQYPYLPRLRDSKVLLDAIQDGLMLPTWQHDTFAYADHYDDQTGRYQGMRRSEIVILGPDGRGLLVKPEIAVRQTEAEKPAQTPEIAAVPDTYRPAPTGTDVRMRETVGTGALNFDEAEGTRASAPRLARRFHGSVSLDPMRLSRDAGNINQEVIQHLAALMGAKAQITLEIRVDVPDGVPDNIVRIVMENCRTLKFTSSEFEEE